MQNDWAYEELYRARLWDKRCLRTLIVACQQLAEAAQMSFSRALGSRRKAVSRILHHKHTSAQDLLHGHVRATSVRAQSYPFILVASDTTNLDFTSRKATWGLGPISTQPQMQGFFLHSALAITRPWPAVPTPTCLFPAFRSGDHPRGHSHRNAAPAGVGPRPEPDCKVQHADPKVQPPRQASPRPEGEPQMERGAGRGPEGAAALPKSPPHPGP